MRKYQVAMADDVAMRAAEIGMLNAARQLGYIRELPHSGPMAHMQFMAAPRYVEQFNRIALSVGMPIARRVS